MVDEPANENINAPGEDTASVPDFISDLVADAAIPAIPAPVRRNALKAFAQLCSAVIDIPVAFLTGKADEMRAETAARIKFTNVSAAQIAEQMQTDPEYARVAVHKFGQRVLRDQVNLDMISQRTAIDLQGGSDSIDQPASQQADNVINDDWLNAFETEAKQKSTEDMQLLFSKILAGEIRRPGSYSTRTVKILGSIDQNVANHFVKFCSMSVATFGDIRVPSLGGNAVNNVLQPYGLNFATLNLLNEHGLVIPDYNSRNELTPCIALPIEVKGAEGQAVCIPFNYQSKHWILMPKSNDNIGKKLQIDGVALTQSGRELFNIVQVEPMEHYSRELTKFFESKGFSMLEVANGQPRPVNVNNASSTTSIVNPAPPSPTKSDTPFPRAGCHADTMRALLDFRPQKLVYVSLRARYPCP